MKSLFAQWKEQSKDDCITFIRTRTPSNTDEFPYQYITFEKDAVLLNKEYNIDLFECDGVQSVALDERDLVDIVCNHDVTIAKDVNQYKTRY